jgi:hypothetical protein
MAAVIEAANTTSAANQRVVIGYTFIGTSDMRPAQRDCAAVGGILTISHRAYVSRYSVAQLDGERGYHKFSKSDAIRPTMCLCPPHGPWYILKAP